MEERIVRDAVRLMPSSLRRVLERHAGELAEGLGEAAGDEGEPGHMLLPAQRGESAAARLEDQIDEAVRALDGERPLAEAARRFGALAHIVGDLNNPLQVSDQDPEESRYARAYARYVAGRLREYPLVFYGWDDRLLASGDVGGFAAASAGRARRYYPHIRRAYARGNPASVAQRFDARSLPFGIGSLSYSRAVTDTARVWLHVWKRANGDLTGLPYAPPRPAARASIPPSGEVR